MKRERKLVARNEGEAYADVKVVDGPRYNIPAVFVNGVRIVGIKRVNIDTPCDGITVTTVEMLVNLEK